MTKFNGYRTSRIGGGGLYNGYTTPKAKQDWTVGEIVNVGFVRGLEVIRKASGTYVLWQALTDRFYTFQPHLGLSRHDSLNAALAA